MQRYREAILYAIFIVIGFVYAVMKVQPEVVKIIDIENNIKSQTIQAEDLERKLETLKKAEQEKISISGQIKNIYKPESATVGDVESSFSVMLDDIIDMTKYNGVKVYSIEYVYNPAEDDFVKGAADKYNVCQLNMSIIADYPDIESFLKDLFKYPYLVNLDKIELVPYPKDKKILMAALQIKLYAQNTTGTPATATPAATTPNAAPAPNGPAQPQQPSQAVPQQ